MRILQLVHTPQRRGAEVFASQLAAAHRGAGCAVACVFLYPFAGEPALPLGPDDVVLGGVEHHPLDRVIGFDPFLTRRVRAEITRFAPDVVQVNGGRTLKYGALACRKKHDGTALVYRNIGDPSQWGSKGGQRAFYRRFVMPRLDGIVGVSDATLRALGRLFDLNVATQRIPNAVDLTTFRPVRSRDAVREELGVGLGAPAVVFVGSLTSEKRPDLLPAVFGRIVASFPDAWLWVLGDGPLRTNLERDLRETGLANRARVLGTRTDVADVMAAADVLLVTSDTEGVPAVVLEAGAVGVPTVATRVGGIPECVLDGQTGFLVAAGEVEQIARAAVALLGDEVLRDKMGHRARGFVEESFGLTAVAAEYLRFYERILEARAARPS